MKSFVRGLISILPLEYRVGFSCCAAAVIFVLVGTHLWLLASELSLLAKVIGVPVATLYWSVLGLIACGLCGLTILAFDIFDLARGQTGRLGAAVIVFITCLADFFSRVLSLLYIEQLIARKPQDAYLLAKAPPSRSALPYDLYPLSCTLLE